MESGARPLPPHNVFSTTAQALKGPDMNRQERATRLVRRIAVQDSSGERHTIEEWGDFMRQQWADGSWSEWARSGGRLRLGSRHVNPTDDEKVFELPDTGERLAVIAGAP